MIAIDGQSVWNIIIALLVAISTALQQIGHSKTQTNISNLKDAISKSGGKSGSGAS